MKHSQTPTFDNIIQIPFIVDIWSQEEMKAIKLRYLYDCCTRTLQVAAGNTIYFVIHLQRFRGIDLASDSCTLFVYLTRNTKL